MLFNQLVERHKCSNPAHHSASNHFFLLCLLQLPAGWDPGSTFPQQCEHRDPEPGQGLRADICKAPRRRQTDEQCHKQKAELNRKTWNLQVREKQSPSQDWHGKSSSSPLSMSPSFPVIVPSSSLNDLLVLAFWSRVSAPEITYTSAKAKIRALFW